MAQDADGRMDGLPPLRERPDDILPLASAFLKEVSRAVGRPAAGISEDARERLQQHAWPGNVRELTNAIERAVILCDGGLVTSEHLPIAVAAASPLPATAGLAPSADAFPPGGVKLEAVERDLVRKAFARAKAPRSRRARRRT
jgi:DNA-binding NtrC family response regulator